MYTNLSTHLNAKTCVRIRMHLQYNSILAFIAYMLYDICVPASVVDTVLCRMRIERI